MFVLKKMYKTVLKRVIGKYLKDDLDVDQFDVNLMNGSLLLNTLELNVEEMNMIMGNMKTPFRFSSCVLDHFELKIPSFDGMLSEGCNVTVAGVEAKLTLTDGQVSNSKGQATNLRKENVADENITSPNTLASTGEGLTDLTALIEKIASKINLTITDVHIEIYVPQISHSIVLEFPGIYSYDEDAAQFKASARAPKTEPTPGTGGEGSTQTTPRRTIRFDQFSIYIAEKYKDSYDGLRGLLGLGEVSSTTCKIITCGRNANKPSGAKSASVVNYLTFTMTEYFSDTFGNKDGINSTNTTIEGFIENFSMSVPSKHCMDIFLASIDTISGAIGSSDTSTVKMPKNTSKNLLDAVESKHTKHSITVRLSLLQTSIDLYHTFEKGSNLPILKCLSILNDNTVLELVSTTNTKSNSLGCVESSVSSMTSKFILGSPTINECIVNFNQNKNYVKEQVFQILKCKEGDAQTHKQTFKAQSRFILNYSVDKKGVTTISLLADSDKVNIAIDLVILNTWLGFLSAPADYSGTDIGSEEDIVKRDNLRATTSTLIHIPKGSIKLLICEHEGDGKNAGTTPRVIQRRWKDAYFYVNVVDLKIALGDQIDHELLTAHCKRFIQHNVMKSGTNPGEATQNCCSSPNMDVMLTFKSFTVDRYLQSSTPEGTGQSMIEACGGKINVNDEFENSGNNHDKVVLPTVCIHPTKSNSTRQKTNRDRDSDGCNTLYCCTVNGNSECFYKSFIHQNINVKSSQYRSYEPDFNSAKAGIDAKQEGREKSSFARSSYDIDNKRKALLSKENNCINDAKSCIEVCLPICEICMTEQDYALTMLLVDDLLVDNAYPVSCSSPIEATDTQIKSSGIKQDQIGVVSSALCVQILRCEIYLREIDLPLSMVNTEDGTSITWNINQELDKRLQTFPASTGVRETNFIKRCIEQLKQRLYQNQCMEYKATMADFQLIQLDGIQEGGAKTKSYMRMSAADLTLSEVPYKESNKHKVDYANRQSCPNIHSRTVLYGTKWGLEKNKYATHVPFGSMKYGSMLFMTISTTLSNGVEDDNFQEVEVDGDVYGVTFRYSVPSSWLFRVIDLILNPRKEKNVVYGRTTKSPAADIADQEKNEFDIFTNVSVRFHETIVDYIATQVNSRAILLINSLNVSTNIVTNSNESVFQISIEDLSVMLRESSIPYHEEESRCRLIVISLGSIQPTVQDQRVFKTTSNIHKKQKRTKLTVWDVQHLLTDAGYVKVMDLDDLNVILKIRSEETLNDKARNNSANGKRKEQLPLTIVTITIGVIQLFTCYDSCNKLIDTLSMWWEEYGATDMFLVKWINKTLDSVNVSPQNHEKPVNRNAESCTKECTRDITSISRPENQNPKKVPTENDSESPMVSLLSHINDESAFGSEGELSVGNRILKGENIANKPKEEQPKLVDSKVDGAKRKLLIVDDYYNMNKFNESSRLSRNRAEFDDDTSPSESRDTLESSFEIIDMDDFLDSSKIESKNLKKRDTSHPKGLMAPRSKDPPKVVQAAVQISDDDLSDSDGDEWGMPNNNGVGSLMVSWIANSDHVSSNPKSAQSIPLSTILTSPANKAVVKESTGMLDITFSDKADLPEGMFVKSSVSSDITGNVNSRSRTVDVGDDQDCDRSNYSSSNSDFDEGHSSASEDSESELWQSAYGSMMKFHSMNDERANYGVQNTTSNSQTRQSETGLKDVDEMDKSNGTCGSGELTDCSNSVENQNVAHQLENDQGKEYQHGDPSEKVKGRNTDDKEGQQNVKWYKGVDQNNLASGGVNVLPHYIPIVPLSSYGEGAINSVNLMPDIPNATPQADEAERGNSMSKENSSNTYVKSRIVIKRMNLSWKWFDGKDWDVSDETKRRISSSKHNMWHGKKTLFPEDNDSPDTYRSASMKTLLGVILDDTNDGDDTDSVLPSSSVAWWVTESPQRDVGDNMRTRSLYYIPCSRIVETMVEIRLTDFAMRSDTFNSSSPYSTNLVIHIHDFELIDHLLSSNLKKIVSHWRSSKLHPRETNQPMLRVSMLAVKTGDWEKQLPSYVPDDELRLKLSILPLKINLDQDTAYFIVDFISKIGQQDTDAKSNRDSADECANDLKPKIVIPSPDLEPDMYFQSVTVSSVKIKIDYHPKRVSLDGLKQGNYIELINILPMEGLTLLLSKIELLSEKGIDSVSIKVAEMWGKEIVENQLHHLAAGINVPPIRSLANVCNGACEVVLLPLQQYRKGEHISSSLRTSTSNFFHTLGLEALTNAGRLAATTQSILEGAHDYFSNSETSNNKTGYSIRKRGGSRQRKTKNTGTLQSVYSDQPGTMTEAFNEAAQRLSSRFQSSRRTVIAVPVKQYKEEGIGGAVHNVVKAMPVAILGPMAGGAEAISRIILGARNSLDPDLKFDQNQKYKSAKDGLLKGNLKPRK